MSVAPAPKAYSYLRCSTPEQMQGDSFRRQLALAEAYALKRDWQLDHSLKLHDIGVSAFRGRNALEGNLGAFQEYVSTGEIAEGSVLLIESLDRLSRQEIDESLFLLLQLIRSGITIVTLLDEMEYSRETIKGPSGSVSLIVSLFILSRAHEESATKARRLKEAWSEKRRRAEESKEALTSRVPAWMRLDPESRVIELIPERAAIVERIFRETLEGKGQHLIAHSLNTEGVEPWGNGAYWQRSYIAKILCHEAVIGNFTPHTVEYVDGKKTRKPQETIAAYFPAAIAQDLWSDVQAMNAGKQSRQRGKHAAKPVSHMLARLARCPLCDGTMTRVVKGKRSRPSLVCVRAKTRAGCEYKSVPVALIEEAIVGRLPERLRDFPAGERDTELDRQIVEADARVSLAADQLQNVERAIKEGGEARRLVAMLQELEGEWEEARDTLRSLEAQRVEVAGRTVQSRIKRLEDALSSSQGTGVEVAAVNAALQMVFRRVTVDYRHGVLEFEWLHGGDVEVPYRWPIS